jgi:hypothetical protein
MAVDLTRPIRRAPRTEPAARRKTLRRLVVEQIRCAYCYRWTDKRGATQAYCNQRCRQAARYWRKVLEAASDIGPSQRTAKGPAISTF